MSVMTDRIEEVLNRSGIRYEADNTTQLLRGELARITSDDFHTWWPIEFQIIVEIKGFDVDELIAAIITKENEVLNKAREVIQLCQYESYLTLRPDYEEDGDTFEVIGVREKLETDIGGGASGPLIGLFFIEVVSLVYVSKNDPKEIYTHIDMDNLIQKGTREPKVKQSDLTTLTNLRSDQGLTVAADTSHLMIDPRDSRIKDLEDAVKAVLRFFTSSNDIEVERATIPANCKEIIKLKELIG